MADDSFKAFVLDQWSALPEVGARSLYQGDHFFAILDEAHLCFKSNPAPAQAYTDRGMGSFTYKSNGQVLTISYHEVPPEVLECVPELVDWARQAISLAADKSKKPKTPGSRL